MERTLDISGFGPTLMESKLSIQELEDDGMSVETKYTSEEVRRGKRYMLEMDGAVASYTGALVGALFWLRAGPEGFARWGVVLLPLGGVLLAIGAMVRHIRQMDEYVRSLTLQGLSLAFAGSALWVLTLGFLELGGLRLPSVWWVWIGMGAIWILSHFAVHIRAR